MKAKLITTVAGTTTFQNATSTLKHILQVGDQFYSAELPANEDIRRSSKPLELVPLSAEDIEIVGSVVQSAAAV